MIEMSTNIEKYEAYIKKYGLLGIEVPFEFDIDKEHDRVVITQYKSTDDEYRVIEVPSFVTSVREDSIYGAFAYVEQSLKVVHRGNQMKSMRTMFNKYRGKELDLSDFDTTGVEDMNMLFNKCINLEKLNIGNFDTSEVTDMSMMFNEMHNIRNIDISSFDTGKVKDMGNMFSNCFRLKQMDMSKLNTDSLTDVINIFSGCTNIEKINLSSIKSNINGVCEMFYGCNNLKNLDIYNITDSRGLGGCFYGCVSLEKVRVKDKRVIDRINGILDGRVAWVK